MDIDLSGFSVAPNPNCPHVAASTFEVHSDLRPEKTGSAGKAPKRNLYHENMACSTCGDADETWVCLACKCAGCSRYKQGHMVEHANEVASSAAHVCVAISLADLSVWCFQCDEYIVHPKLDEVFREMHHGKFGLFPTMSLHVDSSAELSITLMNGGDAAQNGDGE